MSRALPFIQVILSGVTETAATETVPQASVPTAPAQSLAGPDTTAPGASGATAAAHVAADQQQAGAPPPSSPIASPQSEDGDNLSVAKLKHFCLLGRRVRKMSKWFLQDP